MKYPYFLTCDFSTTVTIKNSATETISDFDRTLLKFNYNTRSEDFFKSISPNTEKCKKKKEDSNLIHPSFIFKFSY